MKYRVIKKWQETEVLEIEANSKEEAEDLALEENGEPQEDYTLMSIEAKEIK